jgi:hypothetical protein
LSGAFSTTQDITASDAEEAACTVRESEDDCGVDSEGDSDTDTEPTCNAADPITVVIGKGEGETFTPFEPGEAVGLDVAPQGGFGVAVRVQTTGLQTDGLVSVMLRTEISGEPSGEFLHNGVNLYCQESGHGLVWGVVVGFDPYVFETSDDLLSLDGQTVDLVLEITDLDGDVGVGRVDVVIEVGS